MSGFTTVTNILCIPADGWLEFAGLENDGVEQEQTYILHTMKNFNVYDMSLFQAQI